MKRISAILLSLCALMAASCGKGIKPRPLANNASSVMRQSIDAEPKASPIEKYDLKFWDSLDHSAFPEPSVYAQGQRFATAAHRSSSDDKARSRMHAAYRLGIAFASTDPEQVSQRLRLLRMTTPSVASSDTAAVVAENVDSLFLKCVSKADSDQEHGMAAVMISGFYFGNLYKILQNINPDTQLPDEKTVQAAISRIDNLKKYINEALTSEKDVNTTMLLQNIQASADSITHSYGNLPFASSEKFKQLLSDVKDVDKCFE